MDGNTPIKFEIYEGGQLVRTEILTESTIKIGKLSSSHLRIDDDSVSRMHAVVEVNGSDNVVILDLGSATGTYVNGERVTKRALSSGDRITLGQVGVVVTIAGQQAAGPNLEKGGEAPGSRPVASNVPLFDEEEEDPGRGRSLEVLAMWGSTVLDVQHFSEPATYTVGQSDGVLHAAPSEAIPDDPYPLAQTDGADMVVNVPDGADGDVMLDGKVYSLDELRSAGKLSKSTVRGSSSLRLPPRARCRVKLGHLTFLINSVVAAPVVPKPGLFGQFDRQLIPFLALVTVLEALVLALAFSIPEDANRLSLDGFNLDDRFVEFILKPESEQEKIEDLFGDLKDEAEAAEKAKEDEGELGKKDSQEEDKKFAVKGPEDKEDIELARERAKEEALQTADAAFNSLEGELSAVWGENDRAVGSDAVNALGNMFGDKTGEAHGFGGLGGAGVGRGGGGFGEASIGVGNVGTKGRGGRGGSGYGRGASRLGSRKAKVPKVIPGKPIISGSLDRETIRRVIRRHRNEYRYCYEKELNQKRDLNGKIKVKFTIAGNGSVIAAQVVETTMGNKNVENCLVGKIKRWVFPAPKGGGIVVVTYPFLFKPS